MNRPTLLEALAELVHEVTHLSQREDDGSHWCRITAATLEKARRAIANERSARDPFGEAFNSGDGSYRP